MRQIISRDQAPTLLNGCGHFACHVSVVKVIGVIHDPLKSMRQLRLAEDFPGFVIISVSLKNAPRHGEFCQVLVMKIFSIFPRQRESIPCQFDRRTYNASERQFPVFLQSVNHARRRSGYANRLISHQAGILEYVALSIQVHVRRSCRRSFFAVVDEMSNTGAGADKHETATAQITGLGMYNG